MTAHLVEQKVPRSRLFRIKKVEPSPFESKNKE